jgi:hypothetical protein
MSSVKQLTLLGRRPAENVVAKSIFQHEIDIFSPKLYKPFLNGHGTAIFTLGVGQPQKISKEEFVKIDRNAVLDCAYACKKADITHF